MEPIVPGGPPKDQGKGVKIVEEKESDIQSPLELTHSLIQRNMNGSEEPHSSSPELWNIDGTEMDLNGTYKLGGQLWYLQDRALAAIKNGTEIPGDPMNERAMAQLKIRQKAVAIEAEAFKVSHSESTSGELKRFSHSCLCSSRKQEGSPTQNIDGASPLNRRGSFTTIPNDRDFQKLGGWSPRQRSSSSVSVEESITNSSSSLCPDPQTPTQNSSNRSLNFQKPRNSARDQAVSSMPTLYGSYAHDPTQTIDPTMATPLPARQHKRKWKKIGKTVIQTSSGRLLEIKGTGALKRNSKIRRGFKKRAMNAVFAMKIMATDAIKVDISKYAVFIPKIISRGESVRDAKNKIAAMQRRVRKNIARVCKRRHNK